MDWSLTFEVDFDTDPADTPVAWVDLSARVRPGIAVAYGSPQGGSCTLTLNNRDRELDPTNPSASHNLIPMRHARLTVDVGGTIYPLWRGFVEEWPPLWPTFNQGLISVKLVDASAWMALIDMDVNLPMQPAHERVGALLDLAGWPANLRDIAGGVVTLEPYAQESANLLRVLLDTERAEGGRLYVDPDGTMTFRSRHAQLGQSPSLAVGGGEIPWTSVNADYGGDSIITVARAEMADGRVYEWSDPAGVGNFGERTHAVRDLSLPWHEANGLANWTVERFSRPHLWLDGLTLHANSHLAGILGIRHGDLVTFIHSAPPGGGTADYDGAVAGIRHEIGPGRWITVLDLSPYFGEGPWAQWYSDTATTGDGWASDTATEGAAWAP